MIDLKARAVEVLEKSFVLTLGTLDDGGVWVADVVFVSDDDLNIYWSSNPNFRHSAAISKNPKISAAVRVSQKPGDKDLALQMEGSAEKLEGQQFSIAMKMLVKRGKPQPSKIANTLLEGYSWYKFTPQKIELIDEENFKFTKQRVL